MAGVSYTTTKKCAPKSVSKKKKKQKKMYSAGSIVLQGSASLVGCICKVVTSQRCAKYFCNSLKLKDTPNLHFKCALLLDGLKCAL